MMTHFSADNLETLVSFIDNPIVRTKLLQSEGRIRRSFDDLFRGYKLRAEDVLNEVVRVEDYSGLVTMEKIEFYSYCEHHFAPFFGTASIAYQPGTIITGLGKLARLVKDVHGPRLQIQETMTRDIADDIMRVLQAKGVLVITRATHLCVCSRGPRAEGTVTQVSFGRGTLAGRATEG
jgi:GTP cyclohydrolase IA